MLVVKNKKWNYPSMIDQFFNRDFNHLMGIDHESMMPHVNIMEDEASFRIDVAAPGLTKEDLHIQLENEIITISAEKKNESEAKTGNYLKKEFSYHSFKRSFNLPENVNTGGIQASYENGVLKVILPKMEKNQKPSMQTIAIS